MSAQPVEEHRDVAEERPGAGSADPLHAEGFEVRRNPAVPAVVGAAAAALGTAYLWRAVGSGAPLDWLLCVLLGAMAVGFLRSLLDSRTPLVVADERGLRLRLGAQWRGYPWDAVDRVVVTPPRGFLRDGRMVVRLVDPRRALEGLDPRSLRHARLATTVYGAPLAVPLGPTTRVVGAEDVAGGVTALSQGRAEVVTLLGAPGPVVQASPPAPVRVPSRTQVPERGDGPDGGRRPRWLRRAGVADGNADEARPTAATDEDVPPRAPGDGRTGAEPHPAVGRKHATVRPIARLAEPVEPPVVGEFAPEPAYDPVIGPELAAARTRVGLSVDQLAERTRIRPHVIESLEVDDFAPCGGDFYARGHIRTLARMLGKDPEPLLEQFERRYATAPVTAKRVFEAELATGLTGTIRGTGAAGPNWVLLGGVVLLLVLVWSAVRLLSTPAEESLQPPPPLASSTAGIGGYGEPEPVGAAAPDPLPVTIAAADAGAHVEVRDGEGALVFEGDLVLGEVKRVTAEPPVTVSSDNGGAVSVVVDGRSRGVLGEPDQPATRVFQGPSA